MGGVVGYISSLNDRLKRALGEIKLLRGSFPICSSCKQVQDDSGVWYSLEDYFHKTMQAEMRLVVCPKCADLLFEFQNPNDKTIKPKSRSEDRGRILKFSSLKK